MRDILTELNKEKGIDGSMVITPDGIMVAAALGPDYEEEAVAAFASSLLLSLKRGLSALNSRADMVSCDLDATKGRLSFLDTKNSYLMVMSHPEKMTDSATEAIQRAMHKIKSRRLT